MCDAIGRSDMKTDPRFATREARAENAPAMFEEFSKTFQSGKAKAWEARLEAVGVPAGVVNTVPDMLEDPQVKHRGTIKNVPPPTGLNKAMAMVNAAFHLNEGSPGVSGPPPHIGQHTDAVLKEFGFARDDIESLRSAGVIG